MLDNFNLIPGEAFEMADNVSNNLINKIASATGYILSPHGKRKDREEAVNYFIEEIKKNDEMPLYLKTANISNARMLLKKYSNQEDILLESMKYINGNENLESIDDDWLMHFMEKAGNISNKDVQIIYAKILAEEVRKPGMISRNLINTISIMDRELANAFRELIKCVVFIEQKNGEEDIAVIYPMNQEERFNESLSFMDIVNLSSLGLIEYSGGFARGYIWNDKELKVRYWNKYFILRCKGDKTAINCGNVNLTKSGIELASIITPELEYKYFVKMTKYWNENEIEVIEN